MSDQVQLPDGRSQMLFLVSSKIIKPRQGHRQIQALHQSRPVKSPCVPQEDNVIFLHWPLSQRPIFHPVQRRSTSETTDMLYPRHYLPATDSYKQKSAHAAMVIKQ